MVIGETLRKRLDTEGPVNDVVVDFDTVAAIAVNEVCDVLDETPAGNFVQ